MPYQSQLTLLVSTASKSITSDSTSSITIRPADVLVLRGNQVIDPVPLEYVSRIPKERGLILTDDTEAAIDAFFDSAALKETVVAPRETYQGVVYIGTEGVQAGAEGEAAYLYAIDAASGDKLWEIQVETSLYGSPPVIADGVIYFSSGELLYSAR